MTAETTQLQETPPVANNDVVSLQISLPQMLDLALGTPEIGVVNFNILHNFLHILLRQINLQTVKVEYRGEDADRIKTMVTALKPGPALQLHEYSITDGTGKIMQPIEREELDVEVLAEGAEPPTETDLKVTKGVKHHIGPGKNDEAETVIFVEPVVNGAPPTALAFKKLEQSVNQLQQQYQALEELSTTPEVIERLKGKITDPVTDMWQVININKRLDANEQGIDKLTTMMQDVIKGDISVAPTADMLSINERLNELEDKVSKMEQKLVYLQAVIDALSKDAPPTTAIDEMDVTEAIEPTATYDVDEVTEATVEPATTDEIPNMVTGEIDEAFIPSQEKEEITKEISKIVPDTNDVRRMTNEISIMEIRRDIATLKEDVIQVQQELQDLNEKVAYIETSGKMTIDIPSQRERRVTIEAIITTLQKDVTQIQQGLQDLNEKVAQIETSTAVNKERIDEVSDAASLERCLEAVKNVETTHSEALQNITQRVVTVEKEIDNLLGKIDSVEIKTNDIDFKEFVAKVEEIETDMEKLGQTMDRLLDEKEERETHVNTLLAQIEILKTIKADKEDLEDALADKADTQTVNRKVSHDRFDAACDDLTRGLEEAIDKLSKQELIWQQTLDEIQNEIASKVDKIEMTPLKDFIHKKLKSLQDKLKIIAEARHEIEAAGTKKKLLKDVQCISCNKDVVMKMEEVNRFRTHPLPCTTSIKPYLTYKLDQVRKQQKRLPHSRNMRQFEAAMQEEAKKMKTTREEMLTKDHLCNRYCGGSHTITTPQQRVTRMGHFLTQWGPEIIQLTDGLIKGKDDQMYRSRLMPAKLDVCGPSWESQISEETYPPERIAPVSTPNRKSLPTRRSSAGFQRRSLRKSSKEPEKYPKILEPAEKPIVEMISPLETISPQESNNRALPIPAESAGPQDEIVLYETVE
ncbi:glutamine-rich protein 2-like isoform X2 [Linepithema humile]|uniref:glutamine-rich protein 2-like isoform X2 n=1 Tax=Linepithema humile TaxID=83485 RepID=UPI0006239FD1|nr:PREDICTED: major antigen-like [Linepithema humile]